MGTSPSEKSSGVAFQSQESWGARRAARPSHMFAWLVLRVLGSDGLRPDYTPPTVRVQAASNRWSPLLHLRHAPLTLFVLHTPCARVEKFSGLDVAEIVTENSDQRRIYRAGTYSSRRRSRSRSRCGCQFLCGSYTFPLMFCTLNGTNPAGTCDGVVNAVEPRFTGEKELSKTLMLPEPAPLAAYNRV
jgi:hypothetical protein